ncbi:hypothetical protein [Catenuloplanes japonicus]|uniref:hypothetical protein n=1 Tax=Catenuloplanes japonicus TaxID=33876 RepID=UPI000524371C|nr:hypothetical protein [Catenuloplanes japonicus]
MNRHPGVTAVLVRRMARHMVPMVSMYWAIMLLVYVSVISLIAILDTLEHSMWQSIGGPPPRYWLLSMGIVTVLQGRVYVSLGVTRRQLGEAYLTLYVLMALLFATVYTIGFAPEYAIYAAGGVLDHLAEPYPSAGFRTFISAVVVNLAHLVAGALIGIGFYRYRVWGGLLIIPVAVVPAVAVEVAFGTRWAGEGINTLLGLPVASLPVGLAVAAAILAVLVAGTYRTYRTMPIRAAATR